MTDQPLPITVIVPAFNRAELLPRALASIEAQRPRRAAQVIVIDDGSEDDTAAVARGLGATVIVHERNMGLPSARNSGLQAAEHPWVALLDSDDEWLPNHLETLWSLREGHVLVASATAVRNDGPGPDDYRGPVRRREQQLRSPLEFVMTDNYLAPSASMMSADAARQAGLFRVDLPLAEDLELWIRLLELGPVAVTPEVTVIYHNHGGQMSGNLQELLSAHREVLASFSDRPWWEPSVLDRYDGRVALFEIRTAVEASDWRAVGRALRHLTGGRHQVAAAIDRVGRQLAVRRRAKGLATLSPDPDGAGGA